MERAVGQTRPARRGSSRSAMRFAYTRRATRAGYDVVPVPTSGVDMLTVHHLNNSRSQRVLWLLEELDVPYEIVRYARDPKTMLAPPELRAIHPLGKSPVVTDEGRTYAESGAIIEYLVERYGNGRLAPPPGAPERHDYTYWLHYAEGSAMPPLLLKLVALRIAHAPMPFFARPIARKIADTLQSSFVDPQIALHLGYVNDTLSRTGWFVGDGFSAADIQMSFPLEAATARGGGSRYPAIARFLDAIHARPAYQRALAVNLVLNASWSWVFFRGHRLLPAVLVAGAMMGDSLAQQTIEDEIQQEEAPGSAIEMDIEPGRVVIGRQRNLNPAPVEIHGRTLDVPNDPDTPVSPDAVDAASMSWVTRQLSPIASGRGQSCCRFGNTLASAFSESGRRESNSRYQLGKLKFCH